MSEDTVLVHFTWDYGPFGVYYEPSNPVGVQVASPGSHGGNTLYVPRDVWQAYEAAAAALADAENALEDAEQAALKEARASDPVWQS